MKRFALPLICLMSAGASAQPALTAPPALIMPLIIPQSATPPQTQPVAPKTSPDTPQTPSPFDKDDPAIARIKALDWKNADFNALDPRTQCAALTALNRGLFNLGVTADQRLELLVHYLDQNSLGPKYAEDESQIPDPPQVTFGQMRQLAAAYATTPEGKAALSGEYEGISQAMLQQYLALYEKSARREFEETLESRMQVRSMALFLQNIGKLEDFRKWAPGERQRLDAEIAAKQQREQAAEAQARQQRAEAAQAANAAWQQQQEQQIQQSNQMAAALASQQQQQFAPAGYNADSYPYDNEGWWGGTGVYNAYYYNNAYRGAVRDQVQNAYNRWQPNRVSPGRPAIGGGGIRGGFRR